MINLKFRHCTQRPSDSRAGHRRRSGFTLLELLVVVSILIVLAGVTVATISFGSEADRIRKGGRQLQSFLKGAQNRAIFTQSPVGVRLYVDPDTGRTVNTIAYIGARNTWSSARDSSTIDLERIDLNANGTWNDPILDAGAGEEPVLLVRGFGNPGWWNLWERGFLDGDLRIRIPAGPSGTWYPFEFFNSEDLNQNGVVDVGEDPDSDGLDFDEDLNRNGVLDSNENDGAATEPFYDNADGMLDTLAAPEQEQMIRLGVPYSDPGTAGRVAHTNLSYEIELAWQVLPEEPCILPPGVVIDLDASKVPLDWRPERDADEDTVLDPNEDLNFNGLFDITYGATGYLDLVFSPQGNLIGNAAGSGLIHLYVCDEEDSRFLKEQFISTLPNGVARFDNIIAAGNVPFIPLDVVPVLPTDWVGQGSSYLPKERRLLSILGQTGQITLSRVNTFVGAAYANPDMFDPFDYDNDTITADDNGTPGDLSDDVPVPDGLADDPYRFAETGEEAPN